MLLVEHPQRNDMRSIIREPILGLDLLSTAGSSMCAGEARSPRAKRSAPMNCRMRRVLRVCCASWPGSQVADKNVCCCGSWLVVRDNSDPDEASRAAVMTVWSRAIR